MSFVNHDIGDSVQTIQGKTVKRKNNSFLPADITEIGFVGLKTECLEYQVMGYDYYISHEGGHPKISTNKRNVRLKIVDSKHKQLNFMVGRVTLKTLPIVFYVDTFHQYIHDEEVLHDTAGSADAEAED